MPKDDGDATCWILEARSVCNINFIAGEMVLWDKNLWKLKLYLASKYPYVCRALICLLECKNILLFLNLIIVYSATGIISPTIWCNMFYFQVFVSQR